MSTIKNWRGLFKIRQIDEELSFWNSLVKIRTCSMVHAAQRSGSLDIVLALNHWTSIPSVFYLFDSSVICFAVGARGILVNRSLKYLCVCVGVSQRKVYEREKGFVFDLRRIISFSTTSKISSQIFAREWNRTFTLRQTISIIQSIICFLCMIHNIRFTFH